LLLVVARLAPLYAASVIWPTSTRPTVRFAQHGWPEEAFDKISRARCTAIVVVNYLLNRRPSRRSLLQADLAHKSGAYAILRCSNCSRIA